MMGPVDQYCAARKYGKIMLNLSSSSIDGCGKVLPYSREDIAGIPACI